MDKYEKFSFLKECIGKIEEDITISNRKGFADKETVMNRNILECLKYISEILEENITENLNKNSQRRKRFFITAEQRKQLKIMPNAMISEIANELNRVTAENNIKKIQAVWITNWLISIGILEINNFEKRVPTKDGKSIGITTQLKNRFDGTVYYQNYYSAEAQIFIYDNIDNIIAFHYSKN